MKIPIDQYDSRLNGRVFGVFVVAMFVVTAIAWSIDSVHGQDWHRQLIEYFDSFWPKPALEARFIGSTKRMAGFVGPYLLAQATFSVLMIFVVGWFVVKMRKVADFSQPRKLLLQPDSLIFAPISVGLVFGIVYYAGFSYGKTDISKIIFGTPVLLLWVPACYAGASIVCIRTAAAYFARSAQKTSNTSRN